MRDALEIKPYEEFIKMHCTLSPVPYCSSHYTATAMWVWNYQSWTLVISMSTWL